MKQLKLSKAIPVVCGTILLCLLAVAAIALSSAEPTHAAGLPAKSHNSPKITVTPTSALPGGTITITGTGFTPNGTVYVATSSNIVPTTITADGIGDITTTLTTPSAPGAYRVLAVDALTSNSASTTYQVIGTANHNPKIAIFPTSVNPGDTLTVTGTAFTPYAIVLVYTSNLGSVAAFADAHGNVSAVLAAPAIPGKYTATAVDGSTQAKASVKYTVI